MGLVGRTLSRKLTRITLDQFIAALRSVAEKAKAGDPALKAAPVHAPRRRLDETLAARKPVLTYNNPAPDGSSTGLGAHFGGG